MYRNSNTLKQFIKMKNWERKWRSIKILSSCTKNWLADYCLAIASCRDEFLHKPVEVMSEWSWITETIELQPRKYNWQEELGRRSTKIQVFGPKFRESLLITSEGQFSSWKNWDNHSNFASIVMYLVRCHKHSYIKVCILTT